MLPRPGLPRFDYVKVSSRQEVARLLIEYKDAAQLMMGGTDLLVRMRDGALRPQIVVDLKHLPGISDILYDPESGLTIGAAATMNQVARHPAVRAHCPVLAEAANTVASYQLRNRATLGGNLANASPCADTAPATLVLGGRIVLYGPDGEREVPAGRFFTGPGQTVIRPGEFITAVRFPRPEPGGVGRYLKLGRNRSGDLALVSVAVWGFPAPGNPSGYRFHVALGSVAPVPLRAQETEAVLAQHPPGEESFCLAAEKARQEASPIDDLRSGAAYRSAMVHNLTLRGLREVWASLQQATAGETVAPEPAGRPPSSFTGEQKGHPPAAIHTITLTVNGESEQRTVPSNLTLLQLLREELALTGTKNGCSAGECGACTVLLDGEPVNACMVLAVETDGAQIATVEGLSTDAQLNDLQQAFVDEGGVQCGFCTPGILMSAQALLQRNPQPNEEEIREALVGNLCRCTGYTRIVRAIQKAAQRK